MCVIWLNITVSRSHLPTHSSCDVHNDDDLNALLHDYEKVRACVLCASVCAVRA
jgi:hypothetical protein